MHEYLLDVPIAVDLTRLFNAPFLILDEIVEAVMPASQSNVEGVTPSHMEAIEAWLN